MTLIKTIFGAIIGAALILILSKWIPIKSDLTDWGGKSFPPSYLFPLFMAAIIGYIGGWTGANLSPKTGRLVGMLASLTAVSAIIGWKFTSPFLATLYHHPAYPIFSDHALLAVAVLLVSGHLGGLRVEKKILGTACMLKKETSHET